MSAETVFRAKAPTVIANFMKDFELKDFQASGTVGNIGRESLGFTVLREIDAAPGCGGYGWTQETGANARNFLNWCVAHKLDWRSDAANYGWIRHRLQTDSAYIVCHLQECETLEAATEVFERYYERAGVPAIADRIVWAKRALEAYRASLKAAA